MPCQHKETCCICLNTIPHSYPTLSCGHKIHPKCMRQWDKSCPLCRKSSSNCSIHEKRKSF